MAFDILDIQMRLSGSRQVQAQAEASAASIRGVGAAATGASAEAAAAAAPTGGFGKFKSALSGISGKSIKDFGSRMKSTGTAMTTGLTVPLALVGGIAIKMSNDFDQAMTLVHTQAGASAGEVRKLRQEVLDFAASGKSEFGPSELANALYRIESGGFRGAKAMNVLKTASEGAAVGQSDLEDTALVLSAALNSGIRGASNFKSTMGTLNAVVGQGQMRLQDLEGALKTGLLARARGANLTLQDTTAALDVLTKTGMPAQAAATRLGMTFSFLSSHTDTAAKALTGIGIGGDTLYKTLSGPRGLEGAVALISKHLTWIGEGKGRHLSAESQQVIHDAFGGGRSSTALVTLLQNMDKYKQVVSGLHNPNERFKKDVEAQDKLAEHTGKTALAALSAGMVELGTSIRGTVMPALLILVKVLITLVHGFAALPGPVRTVIVILLMIVAVAGPILAFIGAMVVGIGGLIIAFGALDVLASPWLAIAAAIAIVAIGLIVLYKRVKWFRDAVNAVVNFIKAHWKLMLTVLIGPFALAVIFIVQHFKSIRGAAGDVIGWIKGAWGSVKGFLEAPFKSIAGFVSGVFSKVKGIFEDVLGFIEDRVNNLIDAFNALPGPDLPHVGDSGATATVGSVHFGRHGARLGGHSVGFGRHGFTVGGRPFGGQSGGLVAGSGLGDHVPLLGEPMEFLMSRPATAHYGVEAMSALNRRRAAVLIPPRQGKSIEPINAFAGRGGSPGQIITKVFLDRRQIAEAVHDEIHDSASVHHGE